MLSEACFYYCCQQADEMQEWPRKAKCPKHLPFIATNTVKKQAFPQIWSPALTMLEIPDFLFMNFLISSFIDHSYVET